MFLSGVRLLAFDFVSNTKNRVDWTGVYAGITVKRLSKRSSFFEIFLSLWYYRYYRFAIFVIL